MRRMRTTRHWVNHHLRIPMIGCDQHCPAASPHRFLNLRQAGVHGLDRLNRRLEFSGVSHHIGVGKVDDNHVKRAVVRRFNHRLSNAGSAHLRFQIVSSDLWRLHQHTILARKRLLHAAIKKVSDVRIFLCFSNSKIAHIQTAHHIRQDIRHRLGRNHQRQFEILVILRHADILKIVRHAVARDRSVKILRSR